MAEIGNPKKKPTKENHPNNKQKQNRIQRQKQPNRKPEKPLSWRGLRRVFTCKHHHHTEKGTNKCKKIGCSVSLCSFKDSSRVMHRPETPSPDAHKKRVVAMGGRGAPGRFVKAPVSEINRAVSSSSSSSLSTSSVAAGSSSSSSSSSLGGSFGGLRLRRLSGCYECHMVVDPINGVARDPSLRTICPCPDCGEIFMKSESLELHQAVRHAVSELGPEDTSRNIVEIIFQSSWLKKQAPVCKVDRILKVNNTKKTIAKFEDYRDSIKTKANKLKKKHPRCIADGNELLRFHCTSFTCSIGSNGSTDLCQSIPSCSVCSIIRDGFEVDALGKIRTMATSGRAHDMARLSSDCGEKGAAMLVCRVIAGRVKKNQDASEEYDSISGPTGTYSNLDELFLFDPKAILPCFVVIYGGF